MDELNESHSYKKLAEQINDELKNDLLPVTIFIGVEIVLGFVGNFLVLYVYLFRYHQCNFRYFVLCLAVIDITSCLTSMPGELINLTYWYVYPGREICKVKSFFNVFTACSEGLCILVIAIDRYRKVCQPLAWQITQTRAKYLCYAVYGTGLVMSAPYIFLWGTSTHPYGYKNRTVTMTTCGKDADFKDTVYPLRYSIAVEVIMSCCLITMLVLYIFTARRLLTKRKELVACLQALNSSKSNILAGTSSATSGDNIDGAETELKKYHSAHVKSKSVAVANSKFREGAYTEEVAKLRVQRERGKVDARIQRMTIIMLILTIAFIITAALYLGLLFFIAGSREKIVDEMSNGQKAAFFFFLRLYFINHVINPIVFVSLDPYFRKVLKNLRKRLYRTCTCK
ncbi:orexin receptor type 2-like [Mercenaria mercenaria]|uniref:orexin receptor type 2-like n=1 Tax=Mercenaria mercenaria TaxID=6596 RepID=UPI00234EEC2C|nr:orexin receptor type 2-like [Mercenaria mercenaria]